MRPENQRMAAFLRANGVKATPKYFATGSIKKSWRLYGRGQMWTPELREKLTALGFTDLWYRPLGEFSGNGGTFSVLVRGHYELLEDTP